MTRGGHASVDALQSGEFSSTGIRVHSVPMFPYPGAPAWAPEHINDSGWVVFGSPLSANSWWDGTGYPNTDIGCGNCDSFTIEDINNNNSMAGTFVAGDGSTRGYVWTEGGGFRDIGEPPNYATGVFGGGEIEVLGIDDAGNVAGTFPSTAWCPNDYRENGIPPALWVDACSLPVPPSVSTTSKYSRR